ncbi:MAG: hypothetical protein ACO1OB_34025, partial [Archangium sp.]
MRSFVFVFSVVALAGCLTPPEEDCGPSNCTGCCDASGQCQSGLSGTACGQAGSMCVQCPSNQCFAGACLPGGSAGGGAGTGGGATTGGGVGSTGGGDGST